MRNVMDWDLFEIRGEKTYFGSRNFKQKSATGGFLIIESI